MKLYIISFVLFYCSPCDQLPSSFESYQQAISLVRDADFKIEEEVNTYKSSWIKRIEYHSCDEKVGYMILTLETSKEYIHQGLPIEIWSQFKYANSFGSFYNSHIKDRYYLEI